MKDRDDVDRKDAKALKTPYVTKNEEMIHIMSESGKAVLFRNARYPDYVNFTFESGRSPLVNNQKASNLVLRTHSSRNGYSVGLVEANQEKEENIEAASFYPIPLPLFWLDSMSRVGCKNRGSARVTQKVLDDVTLDKIQEFAALQPDIASELRKHDWPIVEVNGKQLTFSEALDSKPAFKSCPLDKKGAVVTKK